MPTGAAISQGKARGECCSHSPRALSKLEQDAYLPVYRLLENKTERQTVSSTRREQEPRALLTKRSSSREQDREINGLIDAPGTRTPSAAHQTIVFSRTRQRDKRSHRRAGNKNPERCRSNDQERCRIKDRSHFGSVSCEAQPFCRGGHACRPRSFTCVGPGKAQCVCTRRPACGEQVAVSHQYLARRLCGGAIGARRSPKLKHTVSSCEARATGPEARSVGDGS